MRETSIIKKERIDWSKYEVPNLDLTERKLYDSDSYKSCGSAALGLLTGIHPKTVEKYCPNPEAGWFTTRAIKYLKGKGYTVLELSKEDMLKSYWSNRPLNGNHCLVMSVRVKKDENSMFIIHKGNLWHNYSCEYSFNGLFFINKPTQDVLLVYHKKWS